MKEKNKNEEDGKQWKCRGEQGRGGGKTIKFYGLKTYMNVQHSTFSQSTFCY